MQGEGLEMRKGRSSGIRTWCCFFVGDRESVTDGFYTLWFGAKGPGKGMQAWQSGEHSGNRKIRLGALLEVHGRTFS